MSHRALLVGVPTDYGAPPTGPRDAPRAIRQTECLQRIYTDTDGQVTDCGDVEIPDTSDPIEGLTSMVEETIRRVDDADAFSLVLGGDHTTSLASVAATAQYGEPGLLWIDAHPDFNTESTSPSGNYHGMVISSLLGDGPTDEWVVPNLRPENIAIIGARSVDAGEYARLEESDITVFPMRHVHKNGVTETLRDAWDIVSAGTNRVHASIDMDVFDPSVVSGVGTPVPNGIPAEEFDNVALFFQNRDLASADIVEVDPSIDADGGTVSKAGKLAAMLLNPW